MTTTQTPRGLTGEQLESLLRPLDRHRIQADDKGMAYLAQWDVRRWLIRIFGPGGFDVETLALDLVDQTVIPAVNADGSPNPQGRARFSVVYRAQVRLTIRDPHGNELARFDDGSAGDAQRQVSLGDAHDLALKSALSGALKRCAVNLGDTFGLSLYGGVPRAGAIPAAVQRTLGSPATASLAHTTSVTPVLDPPVTEDDPTRPPLVDPECDCTLADLTAGDHRPACALSVPHGSL